MTGVQTCALPISEREYELSAESFDKAGNRSVQSEVLSLDVDRTAAAAPAALNLLTVSDSFDNFTTTVGQMNPIGTSSDDITNINRPAFSGTAESNAKVRIYSGTELIGQGDATATGAWEITVEPLVNGLHAIKAEQEDLAGNVSALTTVLNLTVDTVAPQRPTLDLLAANDSGNSDLDNVTNQANDIPFTVTAEAASRVLIKDGETVIDDFVMPAAGTTVRSLTLSEREYELSAESFEDRKSVV